MVNILENAMMENGPFPLPSFEMKLNLIGLTCSYHNFKNQEYLVTIIPIHS
jgi:hypothetical protein